MSVSEWANDDPRAVLDIPPERLKTQRFKFSSKETGLNGSCADYELHGVTLTDCLIDTSERFQGVTLKRRVTHRASLLLCNTPLVIFPFNSSEEGGGDATS